MNISTKLKGLVSLIAVCMLIITPLSMVTSAASYNGYTYDAYGNSIPSLNGYVAVKEISSFDMGTTALNSPKDFYVQKKLNQVYLLDSGNNRVVILNTDYKLIKELKSFYIDGTETSLSNPTSIFVTDKGEIYIADPENNRILASDENGNVRLVLTKPAVSEYPSEVDFLPSKVIVDRSGNIYALIRGIYQGAILFSKEGNFERFYGSNKVSVSLNIIQDLFWKRFMTKEQLSKKSRYVPTEFLSFDTDEKGFVYTVTQEENPTKRVRKLNALGENIIVSSKQFGDLESVYDKRDIITQFTDINVDGDMFINVLDLTRGRVFRYDNNFNLLFIFGITGGKQLGSFKMPVAVDSFGDAILVLDSDLKCLTVFKPTEFGTKVQSAIKLYNSGKYAEAMQPWRDVLALNENYVLANKGLGDGLYMLGEYTKAMEYYKKINDKNGYLNAFKEFRNIFVRKYFFVIVLLLLIIVFLSVIRAIARKKRGKKQ